MLVAQEPGEEGPNLLQQVVERQRHRLDHLAPREGEQLLRERARALDDLVHLGQVALTGMILRHGLGHQLAQPADHGEQVVEVVRDPSGEQSDRLHLLGLEVLRLEIVQRGDVLHRAMDPHGDPALHLDLREGAAPDGRARVDAPGVDEIPAGAFRLGLEDRRPGAARILRAQKAFGLAQNRLDLLVRIRRSRGASRSAK